MRLMLLLVIGGIGAAVAAWGLPRGGRAARIAAVVGVVALLAITGDAILLRARPNDTGQPITGIFDDHLVTSLYLRLILGLWSLMSVILVFAAWLLGGLPRLRGLLPATLAATTGGAVAMASVDLTVGTAAAVVTGLASLVVILAAEGPAAVAAGAREIRVSVVAGVVMVVSLAIVPVADRLNFLARGIGSDEAVVAAGGVAGPALGILTLAVGLAVAARWGLIPFHVRVSRLTDLVPPETLPLLLCWVAVPFTVVAFAAVDQVIAPLALPMDGERAVLVALALFTLVGASVAAFFHDDLRHTVGYLVIADAGLLLLAIAALHIDAWGPGRAWVVALAASKTALGLWAAVAEDRFGTRSIPELRGWLRRSPLLGLGLALAAFATFGIPGWVAFEARTSLASLAADPPFSAILLVAGFLALPTYVRLLTLGAGTVTSRVDGATPERIFIRRAPAEMLPVEVEGTVPPAVATSTTTVAGVIAVSRTRRRKGLDTGPAAGVAPAAEPSGAATAAGPEPDEDPQGDAAPAGDEPVPTVEAVRARRLARRGAGPSGVTASVAATGPRVVAALRRNRTELLSGTVLALAILAALTSYGALDLAGAASEPAPILQGD
jgi:formate hydrogenlyase subunit 3/multisubunit Na+/H+ antiporter MnhD subunit